VAGAAAALNKDEEKTEDTKVAVAPVVAVAAATVADDETVQDYGSAYQKSQVIVESILKVT